MLARFRVLAAIAGLLTLYGWVAPVAVPTAGGQTVTIKAIRVQPATPAGTTAPIQTLPATAGTTSTTTTTTATKAAPAQASELPAQVFASDEPATATTDAAAAEAAKKQARLTKIQQLSFDRRPSAILQAWGEPAPKPGEKKEEPRPTTTTAAVAVAGQAAAEPDPFDDELKAFQRSVTLGDWAAVRAFLDKQPEEEGKALYKRLLATLPSAMPGMMMQPGMAGNAVIMMQQAGVPPQLMQFAEKNAFDNADVLAIAGLKPAWVDDEALRGLSGILQRSLERGNTVEDFCDRARAEFARAGASAALSPRRVARLLLLAGQPVEAGAFLPDPETAVAGDDREALNLLAQHFLALHAREKKVEHLERAWTATQAVLEVGEVSNEQKAEALKRSVELAPRISEALGLAWLRQSFTSRPERGMEILAAIGAASSRGITAQPMSPDDRLKGLELQKTAVESLLEAAPDRARQWQTSLELLAGAWLAEAEFSQRYDTSTSLGPRLQRDMYGNFFYYNMNDGNMMPGMQHQPNMPRAIPVGKVLEVKPGGTWLGLIPDSIQPRYATVLSQLYLKVGEEATAFPFIETLAATHPEPARELAEEFLRVWTRNHDPNAERNRTNPYMFMFGFERRAEGIPLTRSKQERNLTELAGWVERLRKLPIREVDESLLSQAFTASHSTAEVYRIEAFERVFGSMDAVKPATLAGLIQQMRSNLVGVWRQPAAQEQNKTRRREKDIKAEVVRGYEVARSVIDRALERHPEEWSLVLARASILHDENDYLKEIDPSSDFARRRREALEQFRRAAELYAAKVPGLSEDDESTQVFETWFYAGLGACDLNQITEEKLADPRQPALIKAAMAGLPGEAAERHLSKFANALFTRMSGLNPSVKFRYLKAGFEIVGDHKQAHEARKVYDYYEDLVTEIKLDAVIDGGADVGSGRPFGVFVNLNHTREIERESGGFGRYLQNQNAGNMFYYNYGRPLENYRDKFEKAAREALKEEFEVLSVTFQDEKVNSRAAREYGWRVTPYAYVLLKTRGPKTDKLPPLRLDLDFLDTSGYVVLPVETPAVPIDASAASPEPRPYRKLNVVQTLDERQAGDGKLIVEVKATALGLVPELDAIADLKADGFEVAGVEDQGLSVARFDPESEEGAVSSERTWLVTMRGLPGQEKLPDTFRFPRLKVAVEEPIYQRYVDADLVKVEPDVALEARYGGESRAWLWWTAGGVPLAALIGLVAWRLRPRSAGAAEARFPMPDPLTPFTLLGLLRAIQASGDLADADRPELRAAIGRLEQYYFAEPTGEPPDLAEIAETWIRRAS